MTEGAKQYGVKPEYIEWLKNLESQPRRKPEEFVSFELAEGLPIWDDAKVEAENKPEEGLIYAKCNGKVLKYVDP